MEDVATQHAAATAVRSSIAAPCQRRDSGRRKRGQRGFSDEMHAKLSIGKRWLVFVSSPQSRGEDDACVIRSQDVVPVLDEYMSIP
ncbi:hypothetical protein ZWY2020_015883 [Hordeum vulgare]|nr:hypothetical protein ZWY2020_015883 [Hordeum vulgare]